MAGVDKERIAMETAATECAESEPAQTLHGKEWTRGNRCHAGCAELKPARLSSATLTYCKGAERFFAQGRRSE
jgi:hypothetical protein